MVLQRSLAVGLLIFAGFTGFFVYSNSTEAEPQFPFQYGLDLVGGSHLVYVADTSAVPEGEEDDAMQVLRDVIERRVNVFGVSEPLVQREQSSIVTGEREERLIVELPGVTDTAEAVAAIGQTPLLEFKLVRFESEDPSSSLLTPTYEDTGLTGRFLARATLQFGQTHSGGLSNEPVIVLEFNSEGGERFETLTTENVGEQLAVFLDGALVTDPVIREPIPGGEATITGDFTPEEAREIVRNLNFGALPLPIELVSTQTVGATLGANTLSKGVEAAGIGLVLVAFFLLLWYRLPGLVAVVSLGLYLLIMLALFMLIPVTLTAAGIAGFILSLGMAVDANILIFERMREELESEKALPEAVASGFTRAWSAIRDGNITSLMTAVVLFWLGTSFVQGFAVTFGLGVLISMFSAVVVSRTLLLVLSSFVRSRKAVRMCFGSGIKFDL